MAGATVNKTAYKNLLDGPASVGNVIEKARSKDLYNMILSCVAVGHALNTIQKVCDDENGVECGYKAWKYLKDWDLDPIQVDSVISHWESKLDTTSLDQETYKMEYSNNFERYDQNIENPCTQHIYYPRKSKELPLELCFNLCLKIHESTS